MATERVAVDKLVTEYEEFEVCDKCGLEPDEGPIPLYRGIHREILDNVGNVREMPFDLSPFIVTQGPPSFGAAYRYVLPPGECHVIEQKPEPIVEVCEDCYDEMFGWRDDDD